MSSEDVGPSSSSNNAELVEDLRGMVNNTQLSDITFVCEDGVEVHACRMLLAARSAFFRQMLVVNMADSDSVQLPMVTSSVLIVVLKFLYVGNLSDDDLDPSVVPVNGTCGDRSGSPRLDWNFLMKVVFAARLFVLDSLGRLMLDKLSSELPGGSCHTEDSVNRNASRLSAICGYPKRWTGEGEVKSIEAICSSIVNILMTHDLSLSTLSLISEEAFRYYLTESRRISGERHCEWPLDEYLRLRQILAWCAIRDNDELRGLRSLDLTCLPGPDVAIQFLEANEENKELNMDLGFDFSTGRTYLLNAIAQESLKPLLEMVDLVSIHPELLCNVIQPLNVIDPLVLSKVLGSQAVRGSRKLKRSGKHRISNVWHLLSCTKSTSTGLWRVQDNEYYFTLTPSKRDETMVLGVTGVVGLQILTHNCNKYEWEIVAIPYGSVGQCTMAGFEFGFYCLGKGETFYCRDPSLWLAEDPRGSALRINTDLHSAVFQTKNRTYDWKLSPGKQFEWRKPLKVILVNNTCTFFYAGDEISFKVDRLEHEVLYPAIDLEVENLDRIPFRAHYDQLTVRIQNLKGFEHKVAYDRLRRSAA